MCQWTFLTSKVFVLCFRTFFNISFFSICFGPNVWNLKKEFVYLNQNRLFALFTFHYYLTLSLLYVSYLLQDWTLCIGAHCKIQTSTLSVHTDTHTDTHIFCCFSIDACAWNLVHCLLLPCSFQQDVNFTGTIILLLHNKLRFFR